MLIPTYIRYCDRLWAKLYSSPYPMTMGCPAGSFLASEKLGMENGISPTAKWTITVPHRPHSKPVLSTRPFPYCPFNRLAKKQIPLLPLVFLVPLLPPVPVVSKYTPGTSGHRVQNGKDTTHDGLYGPKLDMVQWGYSFLLLLENGLDTGKTRLGKTAD